MKKILIVPLLAVLVSCSKNDTARTQTNYDKLIDKSWKTYAYTLNGTADATVVGQQPTFNYRSDGKMYFTQVNPSYKDTLNFTFTSENIIKLTKAAFPGYEVTLTIGQLNDNDFDFTMHDNQNSDVDAYQTHKQ
jgi:hypothetical protein